MSSEESEAKRPENLRQRALVRLTGHNGPHEARANSSAALAVLHGLASSPETAADSIKLLHELQVHQVELDLQDEELRRSVAELESALYRQVQLYDFAPAGCFTIDRSTTLYEMNRTGARLLGLDREAVLGRALDTFLEPDSSRELHVALVRLAQGAEVDGCELRFTARDGVSQTAYASVGPDPAGHRVLVVCVEIRQAAARAR